MDRHRKMQLLELADLVQTERANMLRYAYYRIGNAEDARDILQDVYLSVHTRIEEGKNIKVLNLKNYLFCTLANNCADYLLNRSKHKTVNIDTESDVEDLPPDYTEEDYARVSKVLATLPEEQAEIIRLHIYAAKSFVDIAAILVLPLSTVKSRFIYGLRKLRKQLTLDH